jgi:hypothetical protein
MADYMHSKQAICAYVAREAMPLLKKGIRINAICPGPTDTPLAQANKEMWLGFGSDYRAEVGIEASTPLEQAYPLVFLCSDAAAAITGQHDHQRCRLSERRDHRGLPCGDPVAQVLPGHLIGGGSASVSGTSRSSTRRFVCRPSSVTLLAIGNRSPKPWVTRRCGITCRDRK